MRQLGLTACVGLILCVAACNSTNRVADDRQLLSESEAAQLADLFLQYETARRRVIDIYPESFTGWGKPSSVDFVEGRYLVFYETPVEEALLVGRLGVAVDAISGWAAMIPQM